MRSTVVVAAFLAGILVIPGAAATRDASGPATVKVAQSKYGRILVDSRGRTLYLFTADHPGTISCTADNYGCPSTWPPLLTRGKPRAAAGVNPRLLGTVQRKRPNGVQVTYNGHPLYTYVIDQRAGDTKGQGQYNLWYVVSPRGNAVKK